VISISAIFIAKESIKNNIMKVKKMTLGCAKQLSFKHATNIHKIAILEAFYYMNFMPDLSLITSASELVF
jgi:uncharacterized Fe-S cluster-containing MiaB family protein